MQIVDAVSDARVIAVLRAPDAERAVAGADALIAGGVQGIEVTFSTPDAASAIAALATRYGSDIVLGAGTVLTAEHARSAVDAGAQFLVSPGITETLADALVQLDVGLVFGALTPSEIMRAVEMGADIVKLFPASLGGTEYLRALRGPLPHVPFLPTGGVSIANVAAWFSAGAVAVGAGGDLCSAKDLADGRWDELTEKARRFMAAAREDVVLAAGAAS